MVVFWLVGVPMVPSICGASRGNMLSSNYPTGEGHIMYQPTESDIEQYWEKGYWISPKLIDDERIEKLRQANHRLFAGEYDGYGVLAPSQVQLLPDPLALRRVINGWWANDEVRDMVLDPGLGRVAAALMKVERVRLWADQ